MTITLTREQRDTLARLAAVSCARRVGKLVLAGRQRIGTRTDFQVLHAAGLARVLSPSADQGQGAWIDRNHTYEITDRGRAYLAGTS